MKRKVVLIEVQRPIFARLHITDHPTWKGIMTCGHKIERTSKDPPWNEQTREAECATCDYAPPRH